MYCYANLTEHYRNFTMFKPSCPPTIIVIITTVVPTQFWMQVLLHKHKFTYLGPVAPLVQRISAHIPRIVHLVKKA